MAGGLVEIWQACASGRYQHSRDKNIQTLLDNNFQFRGRAITGVEGEYPFQTVIPGRYPGRMGRHIHFRVDGPGVKRWSSPCYFNEYGADKARDDLDRRLSVAEQKLLTVELEKPADGQLPRGGRFDIVLAAADQATTAIRSIGLVFSKPVQRRPAFALLARRLEINRSGLPLQPTFQLAGMKKYEF